MVKFSFSTKTVRFNIHILSVCVITTCLIGCSTAVVPNHGADTIAEPRAKVLRVSTSVPTSKAKPSVEQTRRTILRGLLAQAQRAMSKDKLMVPRNGSAFSLYRQILDIDPSNAEAHRGMRMITKRYLTLAENAYKTGNRGGAQRMLKRALRVSATPAQVKALSERYPPKPPAANEFRLSAADLTARNEQVVAKLDDLAKKAQAIGSRLLIIARNDAEGRWIYRQMRSAVDGYRLRGNIEIGRIPTVVLVDAKA